MEIISLLRLCSYFIYWGEILFILVLLNFHQKLGFTVGAQLQGLRDHEFDFPKTHINKTP